MTKQLFVGGFADGRWIDIPDDVSLWQAGKNEPIRMKVDFEAVNVSQVRRVQVYERFIVYDPYKEMFHIFKPISENPHDTMQKLLKGYKP